MLAAGKWQLEGLGVRESGGKNLEQVWIRTCMIRRPQVGGGFPLFIIKSEVTSDAFEHAQVWNQGDTRQTGA